MSLPAAILQQMWYTTPQQLRRRPLQYILSFVSITVAVALFVSMRITQASLLNAFQSDLAGMAGRAEYVLTVPGGVPTDMLA
ncbi:MAG: hypothetical protein V3T70_08130, partial [Phycisphaerae bacterium]